MSQNHSHSSLVQFTPIISYHVKFKTSPFNNSFLSRIKVIGSGCRMVGTVENIGFTAIKYVLCIHPTRPYPQIQV
ncbi:hypothetical protein BLOT_002874 [Blomia tropicalis]|nr:hypothetical protein BLOT_002874 [Blomia tropicalis]